MRAPLILAALLLAGCPKPPATDDSAAVEDVDDTGETGDTGCAPQTWFLDGDGDGWGGEVTWEACAQPSPYYVDQGGDCDDADARVHPEAQEVGGDGVDQDCDGADPYALNLYDGDLFVSGADAFTLCEQGYDGVDGDLSIYYSDWTDLSPLSCLVDVTGRFEVAYVHALTSLDGLERLQHVGELAVRRNDGLLSFDGMDALEQVDDLVEVWGNGSLRDIRALRNLQVAPGGVQLYQNGPVTELEGAWWSQGDYPGGLLLSLDVGHLRILSGITHIQGDVDIATDDPDGAFGLEALEEVGGGLRLSGYRDAFPPLPALRSVGGTLDLNGSFSDYTPLPDLSALDQVSGDLDLYQVNVDGMSALPNLRFIGRELLMERIDDGRDLSGLQSLEEVGGVYIYNAEVTGLDGLSALTTLDRLELEDVQVLDLSVLGSLVQLGELRVYGVEPDAAGPFIGPPALEEITGHLAVIYSDDLTDIAGFDALGAIGGDLNIRGNADLTALSGFPVLGAVGEDFTVRGNGALPRAEAEALLDRVGRENVGGQVDLDGNNG
ncbi:MAG: hypothetical protein H6739_38480 [Alphaproteobacteria bacterium]|nr:hypothetical protein [Alphaproteobacteria bacterium]